MPISKTGPYAVKNSQLYEKQNRRMLLVGC